MPEALGAMEQRNTGMGHKEMGHRLRPGNPTIKVKEMPTVKEMENWHRTKVVSGITKTTKK